MFLPYYVFRRHSNSEGPSYLSSKLNHLIKGVHLLRKSSPAPLPSEHHCPGTYLPFRTVGSTVAFVQSGKAGLAYAGVLPICLRKASIRLEAFKGRGRNVGEA